MIREYATDAAGFAAVKAVPDPKHVWVDINMKNPRIVVYTGADIPPTPPPEPRMIPERITVELLRAQGVATDKAATDLIDAKMSARGLGIEAVEVER